MAGEDPIDIAELRRRRRTERLRSALPYSPSWEAWLEREGELMPDATPKGARAGLWSPADGLSGAGEWPARTAAIRERWRTWLLGRSPLAPDDLDIDILDERRARGTVDRSVELTFGGQARLRMRVVMPAEGGSFPVLLTPGSTDWWAAAALRRGWAACLVAACDGVDDSDSFAAAYPGYDWSRLARRAWALSRAIEGLHAMFEPDPHRIVAAGHGVDARVALIAGAFDPRITAVIASSAGVLSAVPARLCADRHFGEGVELLTRRHPDWFHPRLRFYAGREHELPTDAHELLSLVAPRPVLLSVARADPQESTWAAEVAVDAVRPVYELLGAPAGTLALTWREGGHDLQPEELERQLDWADLAAGRAGTRPEPERRLHDPNGITWPRPAAPNRAPLAPRALEAAIMDALGEAPPSLAVGPRPRTAPSSVLPGVERCSLLTADGVHVDLFQRPDTGADAPVALWLGPLSRATGYELGLDSGPAPWDLLARDGWTVACFAPIGCGERVGEEVGLRRRHPRWSLLGRMVADARGVLDAVGSESVWVAGYGVGAVVALHVAALDVRVRGGAFVAPAAAGIPLLANEPAYGLSDLLCAMRAAPALVVSPRLDAEADADEVRDCVRTAQDAGAELDHRVLADYHRLSVQTRQLMRTWLHDAAARTTPAAA